MATLGAFNTFIRDVMGVPLSALPSGAPIIAISFQIAISTVNQALMQVPLLQADPTIPIDPDWKTFYDVASYNLAGSMLINLAQDSPNTTYFEDLRAALKLNSFVPGVIQSSSDSTTAQSTQLIDALKKATLADLQRLKDPYGRTYLQIAQAYGPLWGLS